MTAFTLKIIASICMLIDHIGAVFPAPDYFRFIGRIAFPVYAYLIAQGCKHTKNINKYLLRLGIFALISEIPFDLAFMSGAIDARTGLTDWDVNFLRHTNVFYTLFLGAACIAVYEKMKTKQRQWLALQTIPLIPSVLLVNFVPMLSRYGNTIAAVVLTGYTVGALCFANFLKDEESDLSFKRKIIPFLTALPILITAGAFRTDYDMFGVGLIFFLYLADPANKINMVIILFMGIFYHYGDSFITESGDFINDVFVVTSRELNWFSIYQLLFALVAVILVHFYNGKQGPKLKWAFYVFYPLHIAVLAALKLLKIGL